MTDHAPTPRILVIDDEAAVRAALCASLSDAGCAVTEARDGAEALEILRANPADAVLMDIYMPLRDGFEAIRELRRIAPAVKIIAISGGSRGNFDPLKAAEMLGADRTLRKPFGIDDLLAALAELLSAPGGPGGGSAVSECGRS
jgi:two-component system, chemotaxis family, chemotaxis protein CheY